MTMLRTAATDASDARALATATAEQAQLVRGRWTEAAQRTKGLERLRERHLAALRHAEDAAEERAVDDLVTGRAGRIAARPADDSAEDGADEPAGGHEIREVPWTG
ncbi:flagellar FliJ family protein [Blastococcus brunescens]|uniref:Flagellar FliJ protein n=1 Tax=Blastococcus brunescens TaxID=1564165 RepID=A0ABZ1B1T7_9ACTN|nr:flagellar FliJ family protein [Blastococcus sp. BMG 8361]WRL64785.1 flagellar FliJ family protein [Blastococcus sp. BMG 8361]